ncbi:MAG: hypothetical protein ACOY0T_18275 [Myxococcota bacterium]
MRSIALFLWVVAGCTELTVQPLGEPVDASTPMNCGQPPFAQCGEQCVHVLTNDDHCGKCNNPCVSGEHCVGGICQVE